MRPVVIAATFVTALGIVGAGHFARAHDGKTHDGMTYGTKTIDPVCAPSGIGLDQALIRTRLQLTKGRTLTIVAIGSSSTWGAGASSGSASYPSRLEALLKARFPDVAVRVINRGVGGEEEPDMLARFDRDVVPDKPDLVLWQVASNAIVNARPLDYEQPLIREGITRLKRTGADVMIVDPQYTPSIVGQPLALATIDMIAEEAHRQGVATYRRFALMKGWHETQSIPFDAFSIEDGLHMNDWGYDCFARNLATAIIDIVVPTAVASAQRN